MIDRVEQHIRQAIEDGQFEGLPGKGKPLNLDENPYEDPEWRLAYRVLRNGGFTLPWIEARREIESELEEARSSLEKSWVMRENAFKDGESAVDREFNWRRAVDLFRERIEKINQLITSYNLKVPSGRFQLPQKDLESEMQLTITSLSDKLAKGNSD
jgi:DnaJ family protein C protein 28